MPEWRSGLEDKASYNALRAYLGGDTVRQCLKAVRIKFVRLSRVGNPARQAATGREVSNKEDCNRPLRQGLIALVVHSFGADNEYQPALTYNVSSVMQQRARRHNSFRPDKL